MIKWWNEMRNGFQEHRDTWRIWKHSSLGSKLCGELQAFVLSFRSKRTQSFPTISLFFYSLDISLSFQHLTSQRFQNHMIFPSFIAHFHSRFNANALYALMIHSGTVSKSSSNCSTFSIGKIGVGFSFSHRHHEKFHVRFFPSANF